MKPELSKILIERGIIREKTLVEAYHFTRGLSCTNSSRVLDEFVIVRAKQRGEEIIFDAATRDNVVKEILAADIICVDGMDEPRLAGAFMLNTEGKKLLEGKRRGRKPKGYVDQEKVIQLLEFGWSKEQISDKLNISIEDIDKISESDGEFDDWNDDDDEWNEEDDDEF